MALTLRVIRHNKAALNPPIIARFDESGGSIGRSLENNLCLPDPDRWVSGRHAKVTFREGNYYVVDISTNGTSLNAEDNRLMRGAEVRLGNGDTLGICGYEILVSIDDQPALSRSSSQYAVGAAAATPNDASVIDFRPGAASAPPVQLPRPENREAPRTASPSSQLQESTGLPYAARKPSPASRESAGSQTRVISRAELFGHPPAPSGPSPSSDSPVSDQCLFHAFLQGLGCRVQSADLAEQQRILQNAGELLHTLAQGLIDVLKVRSAFKNALRLEITTIQDSENNPFKFALDVEQTLERILREPDGNSSMLPPVKAAASAFADLNDHQQAVIHGLRTLLRAVLQELDPARIEQETPRSGALEERLNPAARKARARDLYVTTFKRLHDEVRDDALRRFDRAFADGYESHVHRRKAERGMIGKRRGRA